jgi:hypothetical protein
MANETLLPELVTTLRFGIGPGVVIGPTPLGFRALATVADGIVSGPLINGTIVGPSADWVIRDAHGFTHIDVRLQIATDDGAFIFVQYTGFLEQNDAVLAAMSDPTKETSFDDQYFRTTPRLECGDERYSWVNHRLFVARGRFLTDGVLYELYRV